MNLTSQANRHQVTQADFSDSITQVRQTVG
jgi:hypothetical protein